LNEIFDPIRGQRVAALPEEIVRQKILKKMIEELGYPRSYLVVEQNLSTLPFVDGKELLGFKRRADIICFGKNIHPDHAMYPLLLIECKAHRLSNAVFNQVEGYNAIVKAYFFAVVNNKEIYTCWLDPKNRVLRKVAYLPPYKDLLIAVHG